MRYMIRKEYFGAYVYDYKEHMYLLFDKESYAIFKKIESDFEYIYVLGYEIRELLFDEEFILEDKKNFYIVDNGDYDGVLSAPMRLHLLYTNKCNLNCIHCFSKDLTADCSDEITFFDKILLLDEMKKIGICEILIGGGEPLIKDDIFEFIRECNNRNITVKIFSNGTLIDERNFGSVLNMNVAYLAISVDGTTKESYEITRRYDGLQDIIHNIKKLKKHRCAYPILISTTINSYNCAEPESYLRFMMDTGADRLKIRATKPNGNIVAHRDVMVSPKKYIEFLISIQSLYNSKYKNFFKMDLTWGDFRLEYDAETNALIVSETDLPYDNYGCVAGKTAMCINSDGIGTPCGFLPDSIQADAMENVVKDSILHVWHNGKSFNRLRNLCGNNECTSCDLYNLCRGGCVARIMFETQSIDGVDPWCIKKFFPAYLPN